MVEPKVVGTEGSALLQIIPDDTHKLMRYSFGLDCGFLHTHFDKYLY